MQNSPCFVKSHHMPFPELVDPQPAAYRIFDSNEVEGMPTTGMVDLRRRILFVPYDFEGRDTALHELAHVLWSPRKAPEGYARSGIAQAVEDARLNLGLAQRGMALKIDGAARERVLELARGDLERSDLVQLLMRSIASLGTGISEALCGLLDEAAEPPAGLVRRARRRERRARLRAGEMRKLLGEVQARLERARRRQGGPVASFRQGQNVARWLRKALGELGYGDPELAQLVLLGCGLGGGHDHDGDSGDCGVEAGKLSITTARLVHACAPPRLLPSRRRHAAEEGTLIRYWERYSVDGRVFGRVRRSRARGGTVLIDTSGSMCLRPQDVEAIIAQAPEATQVAIYSGKERTGELRIVVRDGRRAAYTEMQTPGRGNIVDLPALEWLARQPGPRVWISDGGVTGCGDQPSARLREACRRVRQRARIVQVLGAEEAAEVLAGRCSAARAVSSREAQRALRELRRRSADEVAARVAGKTASEERRSGERRVRAERRARTERSVPIERSVQTELDF